ncbi:AMP-binding protein [Acidovorax sp.]|uniref:class I adenylate-forming enzyme family protein n=1 Tax=Acidovorax sp. TaxID=1872122 RepID=UPI002638F745|nr:AMP-binding protein [Acidovorax sp.]
MLINHLTSHACSIDPGMPAFVQLDGTEISYPEFGNGTRRIAAGLRSLAPKDGARIGILALNSMAYMQLMLGAAWAGLVAVPLNLRWSVKELAYAVEDSQMDVLLIDDPFLSLVPQLQAAAPRIRHYVHVGSQPTPPGMSTLAALADHPPMDAAPTTPETLAAVVYTGGTTGFPKGVMHTQQSLMASTMNTASMGVPTRGTRYLVAAPLFHTAGFGPALAQLLQGGTLVPLPMFRPDLVIMAATRLRVDFIGLVPTMLTMLLDAPGFDAAQFAGVKHFAYGGSPMPTATLERVARAFPQATLTQIYGMTEAGLPLFLLDRWHHGANAQLTAAGQAGPLYQAKIVDEKGRELPRGQKGELVFTGAGLMQGYLNKPEETAKALRDGVLYSGDAGVMDAAGVVTLLDRVKDMIISGGENVYSVEVENAVAQHPAVAQCAVVGVPHATYGEGVHAVIVLKPGQTVTLEALRAHCANSIAGYKCPSSLELRDAMPLSAMGKILKADLRAPHWAGQARQVN